MSNDFVTVATLNTPTEASLVRNQLEAEDIRVFLSDEEAVGMAWYLGTAIGGIKVQVAEEDAERAFAILDEHDPVPITEEDWKTVEGFENGWDEEEDEDESPEQEADEDVPVSNLDQDLDRAYRAAFLGILFLPLQVYSIGVLLTIVLGDHELTPAQQKKINIGFIVDSFLLVVILYFLMPLR
ncbi:putative signal transducing protein [Gimesia fumaroli]|uniref:DUF2007 domain-containing protein n=1 Tax=Gimesia fumaroli TaxID=2527976 RepID=A0A518IFF4_9PLAN|nr:DUF2007 domain-containing protein [Gimesia fumaroli]QDV51822.1 hypothetical protein Enr17x_38810 [Gimesia fumaroli]